MREAVFFELAVWNLGSVLSFLASIANDLKKRIFSLDESAVFVQDPEEVSCANDDIARRGRATETAVESSRTLRTQAGEIEDQVSIGGVLNGFPNQKANGAFVG